VLLVRNQHMDIFRFQDNWRAHRDDPMIGEGELVSSLIGSP
jgi:hypothetical protein